MLNIIISVAVIGVVIFVFALDGDASKIGLGKKGSSNKGASSKETNKGKARGTGKRNKNSQENLPFESIKTVGGSNGPALIIKNGSTYVGAVEIYGVNFNLLSVSEKLVLEDVFQKTLNGLDYPIQLYIQSRKINLDSYNTLYKKRLDELVELLKKEQNKFTRLTERHAELEELQNAKHDIDRIASQIKYGENVIGFINRFAASDDILDKKYFIITPYYYDASAFNQEQTEDEKFQTALNTVLNRLESVLSSLNGAGIEGKVLNGVEMAELLYNSYNKPDADKYKLNNAVKSGFANHIVTSRPVEYKFIDEDKKKIEEEYKKKIEDINNGVYVDLEDDETNKDKAV